MAKPAPIRQQREDHGFVVHITTHEGDSWFWNRLHATKTSALRESLTAWSGWLKQQGIEDPNVAWDDLAVRGRLLQKMRRGQGPNQFTIRIKRAKLVLTE